MKNILLVFGLLFLLLSCEAETKEPPLKQIKEEKKYHKLSIIVDSSHNRMYFNEPFLFLGNIECERKYAVRFDTITKKDTYYWDSLSKGNYVFKSISYKERVFPFSLSKDTVIPIKNNLNLEYVDKLDKKTFLNADTIQLLYRQIGCFNQYFEKAILIKDKTDNSYFVSAHFNNGKSIQQKKASSNVIEDLFSLQNDLLKLDGFALSTSTETFSISANGKTYSNEKNHQGTHMYADFKKKYITIE